VTLAIKSIAGHSPKLLTYEKVPVTELEALIGAESKFEYKFEI
jgi:hypothetical protein